jgi:diguanylate cyclase (GGDEF)-like protein/PAS domain S-box-containing protein
MEIGNLYGVHMMYEAVMHSLPLLVSAGGVLLIGTGIILFFKKISQKSNPLNMKPGHTSYHLLNAMNDAMILCDEKGVIRVANATAAQIIGGELNDLVGHSIQDVILKNVADGKSVLDEITNHNTLKDYEVHCVSKDGSVIPVSVSYSPISDPDSNKMYGWAIMAKNISERKEMEQKLSHYEMYDHLTGLYNRTKFEVELAKHLEISKQTKIHGALLLIDVDRFKEINDSFGHTAGDKILVGIASILQNNFRKVDVVGRLGGDEFGVITPNVKLEDIKFVVNKLLSVIGRSRVQIKGHEISMSVSIGVALFPLHADTSDTLLAYADYALYKSKNESRNGFSVYSSSKNWSSPFKMQVTWASRIRHALQHDRFVLFAQAIYDAKTNKPSHYELLLRMYSDDNALVSPDSFIHVAAHYGLIRDINYWVLEQVFSLAKAYPNAYFTCNLSGGIFSDDKLLSTLDDKLTNSGVNPEHVIIEITENVIMSDIKNAMRCLTIFKKKGLKIALDDFGTGLSSFAYLKGLPIDYMKIDGSFIKNLPTSDLDKDFVIAMVQIAKRLGVKTVAEYVENEEIVKILQEISVDYFQGYHFSKPLEIAEALAKHPILPK